MSDARLIIGDTRKVLATLPDNSVDMVMTSPPFLALRSYLPADHPDKALEMGSEATPGEFIDALLDVVEELDRVVAPHGSICIELGDTYSGSGGAGGDYGENGLRDGQPAYKGSSARKDNRITLADGRTIQSAGINNGQSRKGDGWPLAKSQCLIPELFRFSLAYGFNPLTGRQTDRWRVRNTVRWCRPNPPVGALGDKFRPATSEMVIACKSAKRYFDLDAVRTEHARDYTDERPTKANREFDRAGGGRKGTERELVANPAGAPPLDFWVIPTQGYAGSHYATYPEALCVTPIKAMCPEKVCLVCGEPSRRIVEATYEPHGTKRDEAKSVRGIGVQDGEHAQAFEHGRATKNVETIGWTDCGHNDYRRGLVLDPFAGSGTTLCVATGHGRDALGIDLDSRNAELAAERVGMFLTVEDAA